MDVHALVQIDDYDCTVQWIQNLVQDETCIAYLVPGFPIEPMKALIQALISFLHIRKGGH